jgi:hypothetical protein
MKTPLLSGLSANLFSASATGHPRAGLAVALAMALATAACQSAPDTTMTTTASTAQAPLPVTTVNQRPSTSRSLFGARRLLSFTPVSADPFVSNNGQLPPRDQYAGPLFKLSHAYPATPQPAPARPIWREALRGQPISAANAIAYATALKTYVAPDMRTMILNYPQWNPQAAGWYNEPWTGGIRESIHGTYQGSPFPASTFPKSKLKVAMTTYVLTYYDRRAAHTLYRLWGRTALNPDTTTQGVGQFAEGSVIVKLALTTALAQDWPAMAGAAQWPLYIPDGTQPNPSGPLAVRNTSAMQLDIIVKDSKTAPKTGWVFTTLVYDAHAPGRDAWDKMVPLGAMWGDDPTVNSTTNPGAPLAETVINPQAPVYATETLGWGGRLSGPNDGAVVAPAIYKGLKAPVPAIAASSCMSCHSVAEHPMKTFLLPDDPSVTYPQDPNVGVVAVPGSTRWLRWFQNQPGSVPLDPGTLPLDFDMVFAFKSFPAYEAYRNHKTLLTLAQRGNLARPTAPHVPNGRYNGL